MLCLSIVRHALSAREWLHCQSIVSSLGSPFQHPRFARYTVPEHCLGPRCPLSQTGMTWARCLLPKLKCHKGWHCLGGAGGVGQTDHAILHQGGGQSRGWINKHDVEVTPGLGASSETHKYDPMVERASLSVHVASVQVCS